MNNTHKGWHSRGYLPHFDAASLIQGITFRLHDSLPAHVVEMLELIEGEKPDARRRVEFEQNLNAGYGACYLRQPRIAQLAQDALLHFDGERYRLLAWVIMPNHVHVVAEVSEGYPLQSVVHS